MTPLRFSIPHRLDGGASLVRIWRPKTFTADWTLIWKFPCGWWLGVRSGFTSEHFCGEIFVGRGIKRHNEARLRPWERRRSHDETQLLLRKLNHRSLRTGDYWS